MVKEKPCTHCKKTKPASEFAVNTSHKTGLQSQCKECFNALYSHRPRGKQKSRAVYQNIDLSQVKEKTDLLCLLSIKKMNVNAWTYPQAKSLVDGLKIAAEKGMTDFKKIAKKYGSHKSESSCRALIKELKNAAKKKMNLEDYWRAGRPCKPGNEVVAPEKKK